MPGPYGYVGFTVSRVCARRMAMLLPIRKVHIHPVEGATATQTVHPNIAGSQNIAFMPIDTFFRHSARLSGSHEAKTGSTSFGSGATSPKFSRDCAGTDTPHITVKLRQTARNQCRRQETTTSSVHGSLSFSLKYRRPQVINFHLPEDMRV